MPGLAISVGAYHNHCGSTVRPRRSLYPPRARCSSSVDQAVPPGQLLRAAPKKRCRRPPPFFLLAVVGRSETTKRNYESPEDAQKGQHNASSCVLLFARLLERSQPASIRLFLAFCIAFFLPFTRLSHTFLFLRSATSSIPSHRISRYAPEAIGGPSSNHLRHLASASTLLCFYPRSRLDECRSLCPYLAELFSRLTLLLDDSVP